ncbi:hypothetical protein DL764_007826 [Monosporascus ibericus]|uniref:Heterokaryon incompatibility domain-containing protein n=1 Tax=Monosporascus ibericus TaxID=155417 RepID=A0A4Q4T184_9PEZI|nr:hypothetical protein DL764_007826 [Monosporascus ibericus]
MAAKHGGDDDPNTPSVVYGYPSSQHTPQTVASPSPIHQTQPPANPMKYSPNQSSGQYGVKSQPYVTQYNTSPPPQSPKEFPMNLKAWTHIFGPQKLHMRWWYTHHIKLPGWKYESEQTFRHRDFAGRVKTGPMEDRYLHHLDGRLRKLIVACSDDLFEGPDNTTWRRTYVRMVSPLKVRIATWVIDFSYDPKSWDDWWIMLLRAFPAAFAMSFLFYTTANERWQFNKWYAPVPYLYHGDAKTWSNLLENRIGTSLLARNNDVYRLLKPRHLCFLREPYDDELHGVDVRSVADWEATDGVDAPLNYLFIAYSTEHFSHDSQEDKDALHVIAETAARAAKVPAYWVAVSCMRDPDELESDVEAKKYPQVYRISDVLRGAQAMVIAVGQPKSSSMKVPTDTLLSQWGSRMWTFPEVLLSPGQTIAVYTRGSDLRAPLRISKNQFAGRVWSASDATEARQLIDHYLGSLGLSRLELAVTALKCLYNRYTTEYLAGDQAYALMGLLRLRPQVDQTDTPFQAFARLSLANDSDKLLERYLCTLPVSITQPWYTMDDAYNSRLWDIEPYCQVAAICDGDTVILDGARGASIRWKSFFPVGFETGPSFKRQMAVLAMQNNGTVFVVAIVLCTFSGVVPLLAFFGVVLLLLAIWIWLQSPRLIRTTYGGKLTDVQAALFGFEGYINAPAVERSIFGGCFNRMGWSANGSPLSRSVVNEHGERFGVDPTKDPAVRELVERAKHAKPGDMRVFTLVDTYNMEMTMFEAVRPPTCVFLCASEGGMQRAIACSYNWTTQTMYRETVLRMPTPSLNRVERVPRFRIGIQRAEMPSRPVVGVTV